MGLGSQGPWVPGSLGPRVPSPGSLGPLNIVSLYFFVCCCNLLGIIAFLEEWRLCQVVESFLTSLGYCQICCHWQHWQKLTLVTSTIKLGPCIWFKLDKSTWWHQYMMTSLLWHHCYSGRITMMSSCALEMDKSDNQSVYQRKIIPNPYPTSVCIL